MNLCRTLFAAVALLLSVQAWAGSVNVNVADARQLSAELEGIGPALAERIVQYRQWHGPYERASDLMNVPYIGRTRFDRIREAVRVD